MYFDSTSVLYITMYYYPLEEKVTIINNVCFEDKILHEVAY